MYMGINEVIGLHHSMAFTHAIHAVEPQLSKQVCPQNSIYSSVYLPSDTKSSVVF